MSSLKQLPTKKFTSQHGFSLLELVLVMFIIGLIASTPLMFIDNQENQLRYEETVQKMELISRALYQRESYRNQPILSGFIIDNGVLPPDQDYESSPHNIGISPLINKVDDYDTNDETWLDYSDWLPLESRRPYYNLGGTSDQLTNGFAQLKGFRGRYIHQGLDSNNDFKDSWGNDFIIDVSSSIGSYGYDASNAYRSISQQLTGNQWQIPLSSIDINIINNTSSTITNTPVVLLVFTNKQDASDSGKESDAWLTYHFDASVASGAQQSSIGVSWNKEGTPLNSTQAQGERIPAGDHWVIYSPDTTSSPSALPSGLLRVVPGATQPSLTLTVNP